MLNLATRESRKLKTPLTGTAEILDEVGESIAEFENKENLISIYKDIYQNLKTNPKKGL